MPDLTKLNTKQDERVWMGTGALPASLSSGGAFQGEAGRHVSHPEAGQKEGRGGLFLLERSPGETSGKGKKKK